MKAPVQPSYKGGTFHGFYVYDINSDKGLRLKGRISSLFSDGRLMGQPKRILRINETLYTSSEYIIKANDIDDLEENGILEMPL